MKTKYNIINMKKLFVIAALIALTSAVKGQQTSNIILLDAKSHNQSIATCEGEFYDNKRNGTYATNIDYWTTICPENGNSRTRLEFDMFDIHPSDTVWIFYGQTINDQPATSQVTGKNYFQNQELEDRSVSPPITDVSGCLTVRLKSNSMYVGEGWKARISCEANCQDVYVALAPTFTKFDENGNKTTRPVRQDFEIDTVRITDPTVGYDFTMTDETGKVGYYKRDTIKFDAIDICQGDSVVLQAAPDFRYNDKAYHQSPENCIYMWGFGDSETSYDTVYYNPFIGHKWLKVSGYDLNLYIKDTSYGGCVAKNTLNARVRIAQNPVKKSNPMAAMCSGDSQPVSVDYTGNATVVIDSMHINQAQREIFETRTFLPDGGASDGGSGCYTSTLTFSSFGAGTTLSSGKEILDVCITMEHSSVGDIGIELECPDSKKVQLKYNTKHKANNMANPNSKIFLGEPAGPIQTGYLYSNLADGTPITDSNANPIGQCWQYCWSNIYLNNQQGVLTGLSPNIVRNYSRSIRTDSVFVNNLVDSTHFWSEQSQVSITKPVAADTIHIYNGTMISAKGNDTVIHASGGTTIPNADDVITFQTGDSYQSVSTGNEYVCSLQYDTNVFETGDKFLQSMTVIENGAANPPVYGDTCISHRTDITIYNGSAATVPAFADTVIINGGNSVTIKNNTQSNTVTYDSILIVTLHKAEYRPYKDESFNAKYGEYIRNIAYNYTVDSVVSTGDTSQFFQTPIQNISGNTAYSEPQTPEYIQAITPDLNGFDNLIGCPLNGTWTIRICDDVDKDNGWICSWWLDLKLSSATDWTYSVPIDTVIWGGPYIANSKPMSAVIAPPIKSCGDFTYNIKVIDDFGCEWPAQSNISIVCTPVVDLGPDKETCEGKPVTLDAGNLGAAHYDWEPTGETTKTITVNPPENVFGPQTYAVMVTNHNEDLYCYGNDTITVNIHPAAAASFTSDKYPLEGCEPYTFRLYSTSSDASKFEWRLGEYTSTEQNPEFTFPYGDYDLHLKVTSDYGCTDSVYYSNMVHVYQHPTADFAWDPAVPYSSKPFVTMVNRTEPDEDFMRYRWEIQNNKFDSNDMENVFGKEPYYEWVAQPDANVAGDYKVILDAYSYNESESGYVYECHDTLQKVLTIINDNLVFPTVITPNGDGINDVFEIHNLIKGQAFRDNELAIYNRYGKRIFFVQDIRKEDQFWNPEDTNSPTGTYFYRFIGKGPIRNVEIKGSVEVLRD